MKRHNCEANTETKAHYLTTQGSKNYVQWRVKRISKTGNCTVKLSNDGGKIFTPVAPIGSKSIYFACGRHTGYESVTLRFPKNFVSTKE